MIIDAHAHVWNLELREYPWLDGDDVLRRTFSLSDLEVAMAEAGVEAVVLVQALTSTEESMWLLDLAQSVPWVAGVVAWVDVNRADVPDQIERLRANSSKLVGVRINALDEDSDAWLASARVQRAADFVGRDGLTIDLLVHERHAEATLELVAASANTRFVVDHAAAASVWSDRGAWLQHLRRLSEHTNVSVKLSALYRLPRPPAQVDDPIIETAFEIVKLFGSGRCLFGSDWPLSEKFHPYADNCNQLARLADRLSPSATEEIAGGNTETVYRLSR